VHIVHQTGERDFNETQAAYQLAGVAAEVHRFIDDMPGMFSRANLLLCRSGASTVAEITAAGKPAVFIPFPRAADDHQRVNAQALEEAGAALVLPEADLTPTRLVDTVATLLTDPARLQRMGEASRRLAHPNAAKDIAALVARLASRGAAH
jgi:UDP-N-acetylglucosamine--N-acetylmuramyl-(pentapeptide) pyrophosphoryl-undecaprenol N-acetylglucosamine transferase